jgi:hypothetical protein
MGYYTVYDIEFKNVPDDIAEEFLIGEINRASRYTNVFSGTEIKWYDHDTDMRRISSQYPYILFILHGIGEDNDDRWIKYYMNGLTQYAPARFVYDDFDPALLK